MSTKRVIQFCESAIKQEQCQTKDRQKTQIQPTQMSSQKYSSPIHIANFCTNKKDNSLHSEDLMQQIANSFNKIQQKETEDIIIDMMGNKVCNFISEQEQPQQLSPIIEDKQNMNPCIHLQTPLKIKAQVIRRSPLDDITPSVTQSKKKHVTILYDKNHYMTPRTMAKSRLNSSSALSKIQRF